MKVVKGVCNTILAFLLCLCLVGGLILILITHTIWNKEYMLNLLSKNDYVQRIDVDLKNGFEEYQYQSGLPAEVFDHLYTSEIIREDIDSMINYLYDGTEMTNHSSVVEEQITQNINQYLTKNQITLSTKEQQNVDEFKKILVKVYENKINLFSNHIDKIADIKNKAEVILSILEKVFIGIFIVILVFALLINLKELGKFICMLAVSFLSSGILLELLNLVIQKNINIENILLLNQSLSDFIKEVIHDFLLKINCFGILFIVIGILEIIITNYRRIKNK